MLRCRQRMTSSRTVLYSFMRLIKIKKDRGISSIFGNNWNFYWILQTILELNLIETLDTQSLIESYSLQ